jgi:glycosyltransferase involved in cell wall biosynthesis
VTPQKGPFFFLEVAEQLLAEDLNWRFLVAGDGDSLTELIERAALSGVTNRVHFCGFVSESERDRLLGLSDALLAPSVSEPVGLATLDGVRAGLPVVASRQSGVAEWLPDELLVDYWDVEETCRMLKKFRNDPDESAAASAIACAATDSLKPEHARDLVVACYARALEGYKRYCDPSSSIWSLIFLRG